MKASRATHAQKVFISGPHLPRGCQPGDLLQMEDEMRWHDAIED